MCGIVGYVGEKPVLPLLLGGLKRLEYRGYDSAGVAVIPDGGSDNGTPLKVTKSAGRISVLEQLIDFDGPPATLGIAHTRWATHGAPNDRNAHPHCDSAGRIALVHNGIIDNYHAIKTFLSNEGI